MTDSIPEGFHRMPDGSIMADEDHINEYKKGGKVKKKRCPKGKRRSKKTGKCVKVKKTRLATIPERRGAFRPSGTTGTLTADKALQFGSGKMATEARIARLQNLVDTQSSNLSHAALQKHLVALGYKPVPELQREQRYLGDIVDSTGARFAGAPGGDDGNFINDSPFSADRNRLRIQRKWEQGQPITRGELRRALHNDAWEGENITYVVRDDDNTFADDDFLGSYGHGQVFFDDIGFVEDLENLRAGARRGQRRRTPGPQAYGGPPGFGRGADPFGGGARSQRQYRASSSSGGSESDESRLTTINRQPPFGQPNREYVRGRSDEPASIAGGISPWQGSSASSVSGFTEVERLASELGAPPSEGGSDFGELASQQSRPESRPVSGSVASGDPTLSGPGTDISIPVSQPKPQPEPERALTETTEEFSDIGTSVSGREPPRFTETAGELAGQAAGAVGTGAINVAQTAGRLGYDLGAGAGTAIYDRLPSARDVGEVVVGGGLDLASGAGRALYNRLPEGPDMGRFLNDASGLVSDAGDSVRGGMRQVPGREILGGLNDRPFDEEGSSVVAVSTPAGAESSIAGTSELGIPREGGGESVAESAPRSEISFDKLSGEFYPRGGARGRDDQPTPFRRPSIASGESRPVSESLPRRESISVAPSTASDFSDFSNLSRPDTEEIEAVEALKALVPDTPPSKLAPFATPREFAKVETFLGEERSPAREVSRLRNLQSLAYKKRQEKLERQGLDQSVEGVQINGVDIDLSEAASSDRPPSLNEGEFFDTSTESGTDATSIDEPI
mgnify:CR=1 FL=1